MGKEFVDAPWAKEAVKIIDRAIADHNRLHPKERMHIVWGDPANDPDGEVPAEMQFGLLNFDDIDFEIRITDPEALPLMMRVDSEFLRPIRFRMNPREIFNVLLALWDNCRPVLSRRRGTDKIDLWAISTYLFVAGLSSEILRYGLHSVAASMEMLTGDGIDFWEPDEEDGESP